MTENKKNNDLQNMEFQVSPDLEYHYRDVSNVYVGVGEVIIEFGNIHRAMPNHASISNRIVLSIGNAYTLIQTLQQGLQEAQIQIQRNLQEQQEQMK
jgi:Protein of unknown function (DUF3467)